MVNDTSPDDALAEWSWLRDDPADISLDMASFDVVAVIFPMGAPADTQRARLAIERSTFQPRAIVSEDDIPDDAGWIWAVPDTCVPQPECLNALVSRAAKNPLAAVVGAVQTEPRRRGPAGVINTFGQTVSGFARLRTLTEPGELYQGQLKACQALGAPPYGMLIRGDLWRELGGFVQVLAPSVWGLELGWLANLAGHQVMVEPDAEVTDFSVPDGAAQRAGVLALTATHSKWRWPVAFKLILVSVFAALGFLIGKEPMAAGDEIAGIGRWLAGFKRRRRLHDRREQVNPTEETIAATKALRPDRLAGIRHALDSVASRLVDWLITFTGRSEGPSIDELTAEGDFAESNRIRIPTILVGMVVTVIGAIAAGRHLFGAGSLIAARQLPAADSWLTMLQRYIAPVPGAEHLSMPPWEALTGLASLITLGNPEWLVSVLVIGCVPLTWLAAFRFARQVAESSTWAAFGAGAYALAPILTGALESNGFPVAVWTLLLPVAAYSMRWWLTDGRHTWRGAGSVALNLLVLSALYPLTWLAAAVLLVAQLILRPSVVGGLQRLFVLASTGLLLLGPTWETITAYPGRLLVGTDAALHPATVFEWWQAPLCATATTPLWVSATALGALWLVALAGTVRRRALAPVFLAAAAAPLAATLLNRVLVYVPPGAWTRPSGQELLIVMVGLLAAAGAIGMDMVGANLRAQSIGVKHFAVLGVTLLCAGALGVGAVHWVWTGEAGLQRKTVGELPSFVSNVQTSETPGRTLAMRAADDGTVAWTLIGADYPRMGETEAGPVFFGDREAMALARSVVSRLASGSADDELAGDLVRLGVAHIWLSGGDEAMRMGISNTPGLSGGTGDAAMVWPVPDSGIAVVRYGEAREVVGNGSQIVSGAADRELMIAEPADADWWARVGAELPAGEAAVGQVFRLGTASGTLQYGYRGGSLWWAWVQLGGLLLLILLALPGLQSRGPSRRPRTGKRLRSAPAATGARAQKGHKKLGRPHRARRAA